MEKKRKPSERNAWKKKTMERNKAFFVKSFTKNPRRWAKGM